MKNFIKSFLNDQSGASAAEYALLLGVIGIAIVAAAGTLATSISGAMNKTATTIDTGQVPSS